MPDETVQFASAVDALPITAYRWNCAKPRSVVVVAHGAAEHALRYERFARALNGAGIGVWAMDHRGHGASPGPEGLGDFGTGGWDALVADIHQVVAMAHKAHPGLPLALFGHSMGAAAVQQYAPNWSGEIDALVVSGSTAREVPAPGETPVRADPNAPFEPARTPYEWLSRDPDEVDRYIADPLCGFNIWAKRPTMGDPARLADPSILSQIRSDLPVLFVAGDMDPINRKLEGLALLEARWRNAGVKQIDTLYYPGGRHEMLNETNRDEVTADVIGWLDKNLVERT